MPPSTLVSFRIIMSAAATTGTAAGLLIATDSIRHHAGGRYIVMGLILGAILAGTAAIIGMMKSRMLELHRISMEEAATPVRAELQKPMLGLFVLLGLIGLMALLAFLACLIGAISRIREGYPLLG